MTAPALPVKATSHTRATRLLLATLTVAAACATLAACGASDMDQTTRDFLAYDSCTGAVTDQLKAPSSADFQSKMDVDYRTSGGDNVTITGWVDAQNSFGAKLRNDWACSVDVDKQGNASNVQVLAITPRG